MSKKVRLSLNHSKKRTANMLNLVFNLLFLLLQFENSTASNPGLSDELRFIHQEIDFLRNENQQQNNEISLLKNMVGLMNANEEGYESTEKDSIIEGPPDHNSLRPERPHNVSKRPARLLPLQLLFNRNCTTCSELPPRFYGPPTNCSDLTRLGYTLNGFYLIKAASSNNSTKNTVNNETSIETVFCAFKQEGAFNALIVEKRISAKSKLMSNKNAINFRAKLQPMTNSRVLVFNIIFPRIIANVGGGYNETTGIFQAPKPGVYKFIFKGSLVFLQSMRSIKAGTVIVTIYLFHNELAVGEVRHVQGDVDKDLVIEETLNLNRGEKVELRPNTETESLGILAAIELDKDKSSFSGFLIHAFDD